MSKRTAEIVGGPKDGTPISVSESTPDTFHLWGDEYLLVLSPTSGRLVALHPSAHGLTKGPDAKPETD